MVPELFDKNVPESLPIENWGTILPKVTWYAGVDLPLRWKGL